MHKCISISTEASLREMIIPGVLAVAAPLFIGFLLNAEALAGMLVGSITSGFMLAVFMSNAGGAWDNAKKFVEAKGLYRAYASKGLKIPKEACIKGSEWHAATVVGDTIGDPFKDTSGPALNILIKLMTMISLVFAGSFGQGGTKPFIADKWPIGAVVAILFMLMAVGLTLYWRAKGAGKIDMASMDWSKYDTEEKAASADGVNLEEKPRIELIGGDDTNSNKQA